MVFLRDSSASRALGNVGDRSVGRRSGDLSRATSFFVLSGGGGSSFLVFGLGASSSRVLLLSPLSVEFWLSQLIWRGESNGGTDDREAWSALAGVPFVLPNAPGLTPLTESPRARPTGEGFRAEETVVLFRILRPLERDDALAGLSLEGISEGAKESLSFRRGGSSRIGRDRSSAGRGTSGRRFCER